MLLCRLKQIAAFNQPHVPSRHRFPFSHLFLLKTGIGLRLQKLRKLDLKINKPNSTLQQANSSLGSF